MLPILVATFNRHELLELIPSEIKYDPEFDWEWDNDSDWTLYRVVQPIANETQVMIENMYQKYLKDDMDMKFELILIRLNDSKLNPYLINFKKMNQTNIKTDYVRKIRRVPKKN